MDFEGVPVRIAQPGLPRVIAPDLLGRTRDVIQCSLGDEHYFFRIDVRAVERVLVIGFGFEEKQARDTDNTSPFCSGKTPALTSSIPSFRATAWAVIRLSPVTMIKRSPSL